MIREPQVRALVAAFGEHVRDHYQNVDAEALVAGAGPGRDRVLEVLNGLAITTATVLAGTGGDPDALEFFHLALDNQLAGLLDAIASGELTASDLPAAPH